MEFFVYIIKNSVTKKRYIGQTDNLQKRLDRHNGILPNKKTSFSSKNVNGGLWQIVYQEIFKTRKEAIIREKELKSGKGREFIKGLGC